MSPKTSKHWAAIRLGHLGDVVLATGVLHYLHEQLGLRFSFITRKTFAPVLEGHPAVAEIIALDESQLRPASAWRATCRELSARFKDQGLADFHGVLRTRILGFYWKGPVARYPKFGLHRRLFNLTDGGLFRAYLERTNVPQRYAMAMEHGIVDAHKLVPRIHLTEDELAWADERLAALPGSGPICCLHPYATHPAKSWPRKQFRQLAKLLEEAKLRWICLGRDDRPLFLNNERDLTNKTDLRQTCAILARSQALVTGDSGPMHLGTAVGTPVIALFGPTARAWGFYPSGPRDVVLEHPMDCRPCSLHGAKPCPSDFACMTRTEPQAVLQSVLEAMQNAPEQS